MTLRKRLGVSPHLYCDPLCGKIGAEGPFVWVREAPARNAIAVRERTLDASFLTPIDYAKDSSLYYIVPRVVVASTEGDMSITLHFREGVDGISTIAIDPSSISEIVLAQIIMAEQFDIRPTLIPFQGTAEAALARADAALIVGDDSIRLAHSRQNVLDLTEEWVEMTGLPYVHGFWTGREHALTAEDVSALLDCRTVGVALIDAIAAAPPAGHRLGHLTKDDLQAYLGAFTYDLTEDVEAGLEEFLHYAFYHKILPDVPELQYYDPSAPDDDGDLDRPPADSTSIH
jgi:chorismate dehydratase